ncbi:MAG TPA: pyridoxal-phosphate dependent enzyme [Halioglobus sp.]
MLGVSLGNVSLLRLDQVGGPAPGNKSFKLRNYLIQAQDTGIPRLVSFGGSWSNHLHALAAVGYRHGIETVGIVRGEEDEQESPMLMDARRWGMHIMHVSRSEYRKRNEYHYQQQLAARYAPCLLIPEGGAGAVGASGCGAIADMIRHSPSPARRIVVPVGSGTTLAGLAANLDNSFELLGISALKGATDLEQRVQDVLRVMTKAGHARWRILHEFHCGGFARVDTALREFILAFEAIHGVELDPLYTGKMLFAIHRLLERGEWSVDVPILAVHTGGLQGRRGFPWLTEVPIE